MVAGKEESTLGELGNARPETMLVTKFGDELGNARPKTMGYKVLVDRDERSGSSIRPFVRTGNAKLKINRGMPLTEAMLQVGPIHLEKPA